MNKRAAAKRCLFPATFLFAFSYAQAQTSIIPQVVDGGAWLTAIAVTNISATTAVASLSFFQDTGGGNTSTWNLNFLEMTSAQAQSLVLAAGSTLFLHTPGTAANLTVGWGQLSEPDNAGAVVAYAIFTQRVPGRTDQDGTAPAAAAVSRVLVPFDNTTHVSSMAIANPTSSSENISVGIRIGSTTTQPTAITLPAEGHTSFTFPTQFPVTAGQSGLAEFYSASGSFSILALRFSSSGAFTTAPVYSGTGPPLIASANGGGGEAGNIVMAGFSVGKINTSTGALPTTGSVTDLLGGQFASYTPAEWQVPFSGPTFGPNHECSVLDVTTPAGGKAPYSADTYLDAGTINVSGPNVPPGTALTKIPFAAGGPFYSYAPAAGASLAFGGTYTISSAGGPQVGPFSISSTIPTSFSVTNWDAITSINRANGLTIKWTGAGFDTVSIGITGAILSPTTHSVTVSCAVPANLGTFSIPPEALAMLPAAQAGSANEVGQLVVGGVPSSGGMGTAVSSTARTLVPNLVGGGQVNYGFFAPTLTVIKNLSIQ